jgi:hypothetical protein
MVLKRSYKYLQLTAFSLFILVEGYQLQEFEKELFKKIGHEKCKDVSEEFSAAA